MMNPENPELFDRLREHGLRPTEARRLVLALLSEKNSHPSSDGIMQALQKKGYPMSIATLYQNLNNLVEAGLLVRINGPGGLMRLDANLAPHHHLICDTCGKIIDVKINHETQLQQSPVDYQKGNSLSDWHIHHMKVEFRGTCPDCRR